MTPLKLLLPAAPVVRVKVDRPTEPAPASELMVSLPPRLRPAPPLTVTSGAARKRPAAPSVSAPPVTLTLVAAVVPLSWLAPLLTRLPPPRSEL